MLIAVQRSLRVLSRTAHVSCAASVGVHLRLSRAFHLLRFFPGSEPLESPQCLQKNCFPHLAVTQTDRYAQRIRFVHVAFHRDQCICPTSPPTLPLRQSVALLDFQFAAEIDFFGSAARPGRVLLAVFAVQSFDELVHPRFRREKEDARPRCLLPNTLAIGPAREAQPGPHRNFALLIVPENDAAAHNLRFDEGSSARAVSVPRQREQPRPRLFSGAARALQWRLAALRRNLSTAAHASVQIASGQAVPGAGRVLADSAHLRAEYTWHTKRCLLDREHFATAFRRAACVARQTWRLAAGGNRKSACCGAPILPNRRTNVFNCLCQTR